MGTGSKNAKKTTAQTADTAAKVSTGTNHAPPTENTRPHLTSPAHTPHLRRQHTYPHTAPPPRTLHPPDASAAKKRHVTRNALPPPRESRPGEFAGGTHTNPPRSHPRNPAQTARDARSPTPAPAAPGRSHAFPYAFSNAHRTTHPAAAGRERQTHRGALGGTVPHTPMFSPPGLMFDATSHPGVTGGLGGQGERARNRHLRE
jgi:hypothetical protein